MPKFAIFFTYNGDSIAAMLEHPTDRQAEARRAVESIGGRLDAYYWMFGPHDGLAIVDAPDSATAGAGSSPCARHRSRPNRRQPSDDEVEQLVRNVDAHPDRLVADVLPDVLFGQSQRERALFVQARLGLNARADLPVHLDDERDLLHRKGGGIGFDPAFEMDRGRVTETRP